MNALLYIRSSPIIIANEKAKTGERNMQQKERQNRGGVKRPGITNG